MGDLQTAAGVTQALAAIGHAGVPEAMLEACVASLAGVCDLLVEGTPAGTEVLEMQLWLHLRQQQMAAYSALRARIPDPPAPRPTAADLVVSLGALPLPADIRTVGEALLSQWPLPGLPDRTDTLLPGNSAPLSLGGFLACFRDSMLVGVSTTPSLTASLPRVRLKLHPALADDEKARLAMFCFDTLVGGDGDGQRLIMQLGGTGLLAVELLVLLLRWCDITPLHVLLHPPVVDALHGALLGIHATAGEEVALLGSQHGAVDTFWATLSQHCMHDKTVHRALLIALCCTTLETAPADWQGGVLDMLLDATCLEAAAAQAGCTSSRLRGVSVSELRSHPSVPDLIVHMLLDHGLSPADIAALQPSSQQHGASPIPTSPAASLAAAVAMRFTATCIPDLLAARSAWFLVQQLDPDALRRAIEFTAAVADPALRWRCNHMLWADHLRPVVAGLAALQQKVGKAPKDRLVEKQCNLAPGHVVILLEVASQLLLDMATAFAAAGSSSMPHGADGIVPGAAALADMRWVRLAAGEDAQRDFRSQMAASACVDIPLIQQHSLLCLLLAAIMRHQLRSVRVLDLFPDDVRPWLFSSLDARPLRAHEGGEDATAVASDAGCAAARQRFAFALLTAFICAADPPSDGGEASDLVGRLGVDPDWIAARTVLCMYARGLDEQGEELLLQLAHPEAAVTDLLELVRCRLRLDVALPGGGPDVARVARLSADVFAWLDAPPGQGLASWLPNVVPAPAICTRTLVRQLSALAQQQPPQIRQTVDRLLPAVDALAAP